jgi:glucokinase
MKQYLFGIDLGGTTAKLGLFHRDGTLLERWEVPTRTEESGKHILPDLAASVNEARKRRGVDGDALVGVGIGVPGAVTDGRFVQPCVNLDGWGGFDVAQQLSALCGCPVKVVNDANAAALGEMWQGGGKGCANMVLVTLGTGVGGGVILDWKLRTGVHGAGGEIGHIKVSGDLTGDCGCGKRGCLEQYASATGIVNQAKRLLAEDQAPSSLRGLEDLSAKDVMDHAKAGDELALRVAHLFGETLGQALAAVSCVCDPEVFVLGGGVSQAGSFLLDLVRPAFVRYAFPAAESTHFALATLGNDAGIYGAARLLLDG